MQREEMPAPAGTAPDALVAGLYDDFADVPVEIETVRRCVEDLWSCCVHLGIRPEAETIAGLALSRLDGIVKGARSKGPPAPLPRARAEDADAATAALSTSSREMTDEKDSSARTADGERTRIHRARNATGDRVAQLLGDPGGAVRGADDVVGAGPRRAGRRLR
ncbi:hypothetical protein ACQP1W_48185 [Spirillospora sp. CA-255316]